MCSENVKIAVQKRKMRSVASIVGVLLLAVSAAHAAVYVRIARMRAAADLDWLLGAECERAQLICLQTAAASNNSTSSVTDSDLAVLFGGA